MSWLRGAHLARHRRHSERAAEEGKPVGGLGNSRGRRRAAAAMAGRGVHPELDRRAGRLRSLRRGSERERTPGTTRAS
jgi:hypothetical protein